MALIKCRECGAQISKKATKCPQCGAPGKRKTSAFTWIMAVILVAGLIGYINNLPSNRTPSANKQIRVQQSQTTKPAPSHQQSSEQSQQIKASPDPRETKTARLSNGLGITQSEWENLHGTSEKSCFTSAGLIQCNYGSDPTTIQFTNNKTIRLLQKSWKTALPLSQSRTLVKQFVPDDSIFIKSYTAPYSGSTVDLFSSDWLQRQFSTSANVWTEGNPGEFIVIHGGKTKISHITVGTGNNP